MAIEKTIPCDRQYLERVIDERDRNYEARFKALKELIDERDRLYDNRFKAGEVAVSAALAAQEKLVTASFSASEKAIVKAEQAQKEYNERSNEFRGQLDDQAKTLMPRPETLAMFKAVEEKLTSAVTVLDNKISGLSLTQNLGSGREVERRESTWQRNQSILVMIAFVGLIATIITVILRLK